MIESADAWRNETREMKPSIKNQPDQAPQERRQQLAGLGLSGQNVPWQS